MTTAADTFADFVDHLAEALAHPRLSSTGAGDAAELSGDELAARFHFSRFHFDRMIRSVAGEPPQAFRRRILLERAAYRMVTTKAPLIDIAVEAGYGSHEALQPHESLEGRFARSPRFRGDPKNPSPGRSRGPTASRPPPGAARPAGSASPLRATCTSTHPRASGCRHETR